MDGGVVMERHEGTPQGGPLSPLLANVLLDEVDQELERRGHRFVRYADDCNVYVRSQRAGERVMNGLRRTATTRLRLKVNETKNGGGERRPAASFWATILWRSADDRIKCAVARKALTTFKQRIRQLTRRSGGRSLPEVAERLRSLCAGLEGLLLAWRRRRGCFVRLDEWLRHRLRALQLKHWRRGRRCTGSCGLWVRAGIRRHRWRPTLAAGGATARMRAEPDLAHCVLRPARRSPPLMTSTSRTARCGPACRVVWEGLGQLS